MAEQREQFEKWLKAQPFCIGYPECDGELVGIVHSEKCPMSKVDGSPGHTSMLTFWDVWQAASLAPRQSEQWMKDAAKEISSGFKLVGPGERIDEGWDDWITQIIASHAPRQSEQSLEREIGRDTCAHCGLRIYRDETAVNIHWRHHGSNLRECHQLFAEPMGAPKEPTAPTELKEEDLSESTTDWLKRTGIKSAQPTEEHDKHCFHGFIQDVDGDACVRCGRLEKSPIHHSELIGHVVQQGGKCWCGETHEAY